MTVTSADTKFFYRTLAIVSKSITFAKHFFRVLRLAEAKQKNFETKWVLSSVGLEHLPYKQGVVGSNPTGPT